MNTSDFFNQFNEIAPVLQQNALQKAKDMDRARALYYETVYLAEKQRASFRQEISFTDWILRIMDSASGQVN